MIPTNADCTIFNKFKDKFIKFFISDIYWEQTQEYKYLDNGIIKSNKLFVAMDKKQNYVDPKTWINLENTTNYFTLQKGDILIFGNLESPEIFNSSIEISKFFGTNYIYAISEVSQKIFFDRQTHHFEIFAS